MNEDEFRRLALALPGIEEGFNMGSVVFKVRGKVLARLLGAGEAMLTGVGFDEREMLLAARPEVFHITAHYKDYPAVIARLAPWEAGACADFLERRWRQIAPQAMIKAFDAARA